MTNQFNVPATIITGASASGELPAQLARLSVRQVLLVTDAFLVQSGLAARFTQAMENAGITVALFAGVQPDPTDENVRAGLELFRAQKCEAIVALGGGSPIDAAKAIAILTTNAEPLSLYQGYHKVPRAGAPLVVIPTTAGTGSEVSKVSVITDTTRDVKMMMLDRHFLPTVALVDFELTLSMPAALTAHVGVDTLTHGLEAYVSRKANPITDALALTCIRLVAEHLEVAWNAATMDAARAGQRPALPAEVESKHRAAREGMMLAATLGGMAFGNSSVALVHGMSRPIGAIFHVPHGLSNAVLLPTVTKFSLAGAPERYATVARTMKLCSPSASDAEAGAALVAGLEALNTRLAVPRLNGCRGVERARFEQSVARMAQDALASGSPQNNPIVPTAEQIVALYEEAW